MILKNKKIIMIKLQNKMLKVMKWKQKKEFVNLKNTLKNKLINMKNTAIQAYGNKHTQMP